jgi:hypothetical protein
MQSQRSQPLPQNTSFRFQWQMNQRDGCCWTWQNASACTENRPSGSRHDYLAARKMNCVEYLLETGLVILVKVRALPINNSGGSCTLWLRTGSTSHPRSLTARSYATANSCLTQSELSELFDITSTRRIAN